MSHRVPLLKEWEGNGRFVQLLSNGYIQFDLKL